MPPARTVGPEVQRLDPVAKKRDFTPKQLSNLWVAVSLREESSFENDEKADETMWRKLREKIESMMPEDLREPNPRPTPSRPAASLKF